MRKLKEDKAPEAELKAAITELKACKKALEDKEVELTLDVSKERLFFLSKNEKLIQCAFVSTASYIRSHKIRYFVEKAIRVRSKLRNLWWSKRII